MLFETKNGWITTQDSSFIEVGNLLITIENGPLLPNNNSGYMYLEIKENSWRIFGFTSHQARELFLQLIKINGIGCKIAANLCTLFDTNTLSKAIVEGDVDLMCQANGISKRLANLIVTHLQTKLTIDGDASNGLVSDVVSVLSSLGLSQERILGLIHTYPNVDNLNSSEYLGYLLKRM